MINQLLYVEFNYKTVEHFTIPVKSCMVVNSPGREGGRLDRDRFNLYFPKSNEGQIQ